MPDTLTPYFLAAGSDLGVHVDGSAAGPEILVQALGVERQTTLITAPAIVKSYDPADKAKNRQAVQAFNARLFAAASSLSPQFFPVTLGGDHAIAMASGLASLQADRRRGLIWFDAHTDFHRLDTTITGNLHGLPLAVLTGYEPALNDLVPGLFYDPAHTVIVGARSVDPPEWINLRAAGVAVITREEIRQQGITSALQTAFTLADGGSGVHFSFDLDVLDPRLAPGVSVPEADGLDNSELQQALTCINENFARVRSLDLVEYNPYRDREGQTLEVAVNILRQLLSV